MTPCTGSRVASEIVQHPGISPHRDDLPITLPPTEGKTDTLAVGIVQIDSPHKPCERDEVDTLGPKEAPAFEPKGAR